MTLMLTILGCGSSAGVPRPALGWGKCDPNNPKNRRRRCSLLVERTSEQGTTRIVIDTSPDLREQLLDANVDHIDAVFLTHEHADQTHGIDDLRGVVMHMQRRIPVYLNQATGKDILLRFGYCFVSPPGSYYPPILDHYGVEEALDWITKIKPRRAIITNMHSDLDYEVLRKELPDGVVPAYDGMQVTVA